MNCDNCGATSHLHTYALNPSRDLTLCISCMEARMEEHMAHIHRVAGAIKRAREREVELPTFVRIRGTLQ